MNRLKILATSMISALLLTACGGGGGAGSSATNGTTPATDTIISGVATEGPIANGTATIYALNSDGSKGIKLQSAPTDANGHYSANIGKYAGPVLVEASGSYLDEATGLTMTISADSPLRAAIANAAGNISVAVTPMTELAVVKAGKLTATAIDAGNKLVTDIFKIDIIATLPVTPTAAALGQSSVTQAQKDYTLAIAAISQLSLSRGEPLAATLGYLATGINPAGLTSLVGTAYQSAISSFLANVNNRTEIRTASDTLKSIGLTTITYILSIEGNIAATAIKGIQFEIVAPAGVTFRKEAVGSRLLPGIVTPLVALGGMDSNYQPSSGILSLGLLSSTGIGPGTLATISCDIQPGWAVPPASAFSVRNVSAYDGSIAAISGVSVTLR